MQSPLDVGENLGIDKIGTVGVEIAAKGLDHGLLRICNPPFADKTLKPLGQPIGAFDVERFHAGIIDVLPRSANAAG